MENRQIKNKTRRSHVENPPVSNPCIKERITNNDNDDNDSQRRMMMPTINNEEPKKRLLVVQPSTAHPCVRSEN